jgi:hypothetical protein
MAISKQVKTLIASATSVAAGTTKASPAVVGSSVDCTTYYGGDAVYKITNGGSAPTTAVALTLQSSPDGTNWYDYFTVGGDTTASSSYSGVVPIDRSIMYVRCIAYGNATNAVTVEAFLMVTSGI